MNGSDKEPIAFFSEDQPAASPYWEARRELAKTCRAFQESLCTSDIDLATARALTALLKRETLMLQQLDQYHGTSQLARTERHGSSAVINHEMLAVGGKSHPCTPVIDMWHEGDLTLGTVNFGWAFEGPPGHVHGGWIAAIFDHFMGMAHMRHDTAGLTGGLSIRYLSPTPLMKNLDLVARHERLDHRRVQLSATIKSDDRVTATAEATFVRPRIAPSFDKQKERFT